jgi:hypothetical protein
MNTEGMIWAIREACVVQVRIMANLVGMMFCGSVSAGGPSWTRWEVAGNKDSDFRFKITD